MQPLFSVIIPVYNVSSYLKECVLSICGQKFDDYEIILVDDGSSDGSSEICDELKQNNSKIKVIHKKNEGVAFARRDGVSIAEGEYCFFIDSDDVLLSGCFIKVAELVRQYDLDIVCWSMIHELPNGKTIKKNVCRPGLFSRKDVEREIFPNLIQTKKATYFSPSLCSKAIRRRLVESYMLCDSRATIGEDGASVIAAIYHSNQIYVVDDAFYFYRYNGLSTTKKKKAQNWDWPLVVSKHIIDNIEIDSFDFRDQMNRKMTHDVFNVVKSRFYSEKKYRDVVDEIKEYLNIDVIKKAITECSFAFRLSCILMVFLLRYKCFFLIFLMSKKY